MNGIYLGELRQRVDAFQAAVRAENVGMGSASGNAIRSTDRTRHALHAYVNALPTRILCELVNDASRLADAEPYSIPESALMDISTIMETRDLSLDERVAKVHAYVAARFQNRVVTDREVR